MAIPPDHKAVLQLLLVRGKSYADLATLLEIDEDEVRNRARAALTELGGADPDRRVGLTDYLLGQADPIGRADASRHLREDEGDLALAVGLTGRLRELFPEADLPRLPGQPSARRRSRRSRSVATGRRPAERPSDASRPPIALLAAGGLLVVLVALGIAGVFGGDDPATEPGTAGNETTGADDRAAVPIQLEPTAGSDAGGVVVFGIAGTDDPYVEFQVRDLSQATNETAYVLWFLLDEDSGFPLPTPLPVGPDGTLAERISIPPEVLAYVEQADSIAIALNDRGELDREIAAALQAGSGAIDFPGQTVLSAKITGRR